MKCYKRIIPLILACMMLAGCGQNVYKKGVESLENKDYAAAQENFRKAVEDNAISYYEKALDHSDCSDDMKQEIQFNVIVCYEKLEDWDNAKAKLEDYVTAYPDDEKAAKEAEFLKTR